jgi:hypothetical protein
LWKDVEEPTDWAWSFVCRRRDSGAASTAPPRTTLRHSTPPLDHVLHCQIAPLRSQPRPRPPAPCTQTGRTTERHPMPLLDEHASASSSSQHWRAGSARSGGRRRDAAHANSLSAAQSSPARGWVDVPEAQVRRCRKQSDQRTDSQVHIRPLLRLTHTLQWPVASPLH